MLQKILPLVFVSSLRFLGLFIVLPVISLYAVGFKASAMMMGLAVGGAYLTQILCQTPIGILSDQYSRKKVVLWCLGVFSVGSLLCFLAHNIQTLVLGRLIQGMGAMGGVLSAMIADLVEEEKRTHAMAMMGAGIFFSFTVAMVIGPSIGMHFGVQWLFMLTTLLSLSSMLLMALKVPEPPKIVYTLKEKPRLLDALKDKDIFIINSCSFFEKCLMTLIFVLIPLALVHEFKMDKGVLWKIYTAGALLGMVSMAPAAIIAEKFHKAKGVLLGGVFLFLIAYACLAYADRHLGSPTTWLFIFGIMCFFAGFGTLEPIMQSLASKFAKAHQRGLVLGMFVSYGYVGSFVGGMLGGMGYTYLGVEKVAILVVVVCVLWLGLVSLLSNPGQQKNVYFPLDAFDREKFKAIEEQAGIIEWYINESQNTIIVKYDVLHISQEQIIELSVAFRKGAQV
ncbi:MFS transporter [Helicobacter ailurogastricus]|uniref:Putative efflux protein n=1 Tax=Helicobacter ailurogastricus TaxID=1578720 RepID=A0A0K2X8N4_9HELI|nr:MFS transporter [Helicobacter ailurogastricus]CRF41208.1 Putative efflux protein [Helicobacter ailurogastricus]CRF41913.1 Putative efflux protein [Helicobacter ailurogastricus]CRF43756.1 Putative efflux protein [Helicobacter ailurogastricus]